jgi:hypothetical protein
MDVASDRNGVPTLFAVTSASGGALYFNKRNAIGQNLSWPNNWTLISDQDGTYIYSRVTAIRHHGDQSNQVWALTTTGAIRTVTETALNSWGAVSSFLLPSLYWNERIVDIDAAWSTSQTAMLVALSSEGRSWYREATTTGSATSWSAWALLPEDVDPGVPINRNGVKLASVTASRWQEVSDISGDADIVPVVFATDTWGNVYQSTHRYHSGVREWSNWMPFSGKRIDAVQSIQD